MARIEDAADRIRDLLSLPGGRSWRQRKTPVTITARDGDLYSYGKRIVRATPLGFAVIASKCGESPTTKRHIGAAEFALERAGYVGLGDAVIRFDRWRTYARGAE